MSPAVFDQDELDGFAPILERMGLEVILVPDGEAPTEPGFFRIGDLELPPDVDPPIVPAGHEMWIRRTDSNGNIY